MSILDLLKGQPKNKKLAVLDFAREVFPNRTFDNIDELDNLDILDFEEDDKKELQYIMDKSYSRYIPNYIYKLELKGETSFETFSSKVEKFINNLENEEFKIDEKVSLKKIKVSSRDSILSIKLVIEEYKTEINYQGESQRTNVIIDYEDINIYFYKKDRLLMINIGKEKFATYIYSRFLVKNFYEYASIQPIKISQANLENIHTSNLTEDKITIFMLELLDRKMNNNQFKVNDYLKMGISAPKDSRIKAISIKGKELKKDITVADKLCNGYGLKKAEVIVRYIITSSSIKDITLSISAQSTLKIVIMEGNDDQINYKLITEIVRYIDQILKTKLYIKNIKSEYFKEVESIRKTQLEIFITNLKKELKQDVLEYWESIERGIRNVY